MATELGVIEGFYGRPWSWAERAAAVAFLAPHGFGFFLYAPKADAFLRERWREPHPEGEEAALADLGRACRENGVRFGVGLSPLELHADFDAAGRAALRPSWVCSTSWACRTSRSCSTTCAPTWPTWRRGRRRSSPSPRNGPGRRA